MAKVRICPERKITSNKIKVRHSQMNWNRINYKNYNDFIRLPIRLLIALKNLHIFQHRSKEMKRIRTISICLCFCPFVIRFILFSFFFLLLNSMFLWVYVNGNREIYRSAQQSMASSVHVFPFQYLHFASILLSNQWADVKRRTLKLWTTIYWCVFAVHIT